jgi:SNF2 family DNA or RNA helicase
MGATWIIVDGVLTLDTGTSHIDVRAADIFAVEYGHLVEVGDHAVRKPSQDLSWLTLSPRMVSPVLGLAIDDRNRPTVELTYDAGREVAATWPLGDHVILGNTWTALEVGNLFEVKRSLFDMGIELGEPIGSPQLMWLLWSSGVELKIPADFFKSLHAVDTMIDSAHFMPELLRAELFPYQVVGGQFLAAMTSRGLGVLLADEMGLGKTMQALYSLAFSSATQQAGPHLVVAPSSTLANWSWEIARFAPSLRSMVHAGSRRTGDYRSLAQNDVVVTSYETAVRDQGILANIPWRILILDEAQWIKNPKSQRAKALKLFPRSAGIAITGTPIENTLLDMWSIMEFVAPNYLGSLEAFQLGYPDELSAATALSRRVSPVTIRRSVQEVAQDLPARVDVLVPIYASEELVDRYEQERNGSETNQLARLTRLRQICGEGDLAKIALPVSSPKMDRLFSIMDEVVSLGRKALIFASFTSAIDHVAQRLKQRYPDYFFATIDGRSAPNDRQIMLDDFSNTILPGALILNPRAAGVGLNIQAANYVIHFTPEWNPAIVSQASARAHRRGQERPVFIYYLYYQGTVEEAMMERLEKKRDLLDAGTSEMGGDLEVSEIAAALSFSPRKATDGN